MGAATGEAEAAAADGGVASSQARGRAVDMADSVVEERERRWEEGRGICVKASCMNPV